MKICAVLLFTLVPLGAALSCGAAVTPEQAIRGGCYTQEQGKAYVALVLRRTDVGSVTKTELERYFPNGIRHISITKTYVTSQSTWLFRGYQSDESAPHVVALKEGTMKSKSQIGLERALRRGEGSPERITKEFWERLGPEVKSFDDNGRDATTITLRALATQSSSMPASQFSSVALEYKLASIFGSPVYAFQANPNSPILGLQGCSREGMGAEKQLQVPNGTRIFNLHRKFPHKPWEKYNTATKQWDQISGSIPPD